MTARRIFCEGPDDHAALRELICRRFTRRPALNEANTKGSRFRRDGADDVELVPAMSRDKLLTAVVSVLENDSPSNPIKIIGLSFDPDTDDETRWRRWIENGFKRWAPRREGDGWWLERGGDLGPVEVVPLPWVSASSPHAGLPSTQSLERLLAEVLVSKHPELGSLIDRWLDEANAHGRAPSWKMAARFWNGLLAADVSGPSFFDKAFGQDRELRANVEAALQGSMMWRGLERVCEGALPPPPP